MTVLLIYLLILPIGLSHETVAYAKPTQAILALEQKLKAKDPATRSFALRRLLKIKNRRTLKILLSLLKDPNEWIRKKAMQGLGDFGYQEAAKHIMHHLKTETQTPFIEKEALISLGKLKQESSRYLLKQYAKHRNFMLRLYAKKSLVQLDQN